MKLISFAVLAAIQLSSTAVSADSANRKSLRVSQQVNRDLALCGHWSKEGSTLKGSNSLDYFGSAVATSRDGTTIAVSANTEHEGYVKVFFHDPLTKTRQMLGNKIMPKSRQGESIGGAALSLSDNGRVLAIANVENKNPSGVKSMSGGVSVYALNENTNVWDQVGQLEPIYGGHRQTTASVSIAGDGLSYVFSSSGSTVSKVGVDDAKSRVHAKSRVYYFDRIENEWKPKGSMFNERTNDRFVSDEASVSMSRDGNTIAIGSSRNSHEAKNDDERYHGRVRVLSFVGGEWVQLGSDIYGTQGFSYFGKSISLDEDGLILAVGAEGTNFNMGEVKVFKYDSEEWVQVGNDIPGPSKDSYFGSSIALSSSEDGLLVAAGAYGAGLSGSASIFQFKEGLGDWQQLGESINDVGGSGFLGASIAMSRSGKTVVVGSPLSDYNGATSGSAYVYELSEVTCSPTVAPTSQPTVTASAEPSTAASSQPSYLPTEAHSAPPSASAMPTSSLAPTSSPSFTSSPTSGPSVEPSSFPSSFRSGAPTLLPSGKASETPSLLSSVEPSSLPSRVPSASPSVSPSTIPSKAHSTHPSAEPSLRPTEVISGSPSSTPTAPSYLPSSVRSDAPTLLPSGKPSDSPSLLPSVGPSSLPSSVPTASPSVSPSTIPSKAHSAHPSAAPSLRPTEVISGSPSSTPTAKPSVSATNSPSTKPTTSPTRVISDSPSSTPTTSPSASPTSTPTASPSALPTKTHSARPTESPTTAPTKSLAPTSTNIAGVVNSGVMSESVHMSGSTNTKATSAFIISVFAAVFFSFA